MYTISSYIYRLRCFDVSPSPRMYDFHRKYTHCNTGRELPTPAIALAISATAPFLRDPFSLATQLDNVSSSTMFAP